MNKYVIIVAGGRGLRMGSELPKQFLLLGGKPVLMHTIEAFYHYDTDIQIVLVLPRDHQDYWKSLCSSYHFEIPHQIADGGETRFHSVRNGLQLIGDTGLVGVHDGVRPFVSKEVIERCYLEAEQKQAVIPVVEVVETVRHLQGDESSTVPRNEYRLVQTPQVFSVPLLKKAYLQPYSPSFTDDASVVESFGEKVFLTEGNRENIKITTPFDLIIGKAWVEHQ
jgi:2-C-methyl-D-erythritol 4-phosphate cytidylyltransferase